MFHISKHGFSLLEKLLRDLSKRFFLQNFVLIKSNITDRSSSRFLHFYYHTWDSGMSMSLAYRLDSLPRVGKSFIITLSGLNFFPAGKYQHTLAKWRRTILLHYFDNSSYSLTQFHKTHSLTLFGFVGFTLYSEGQLVKFLLTLNQSKIV